MCQIIFIGSKLFAFNNNGSIHVLSRSLLVMKNEMKGKLTRVTTIGVPKSAPPAIRIPQGLPVLDLLSFTIIVCFLVMLYSVYSEQRNYPLFIKKSKKKKGQFVRSEDWK